MGPWKVPKAVPSVVDTLCALSELPELLWPGVAQGATGTENLEALWAFCEAQWPSKRHRKASKSHGMAIELSSMAKCSEVIIQSCIKELGDDLPPPAGP